MTLGHLLSFRGPLAELLSFALHPSRPESPDRTERTRWKNSEKPLQQFFSLSASSKEPIRVRRRASGLQASCASRQKQVLHGIQQPVARLPRRSTRQTNTPGLQGSRSCLWRECWQAHLLEERLYLLLPVLPKGPRRGTIDEEGRHRRQPAFCEVCFL